MDAKGREELLRIAREAIEARLRGRAFHTPTEVSPELLEPRGAFVTLHKHGQLRGCIGTFMSDRPLRDTVAEMAVSAAFKDPRFPPLALHELPEIEIEISVLSPLREAAGPEEVEVGTHGIYLVNGPFHGVLLPQVATEYGWDRETFLDQTCIKAGMAPGCWRDKNTKILLFTAEIFGEGAESKGCGS